jgi:hypothetical protein
MVFASRGRRTETGANREKCAPPLCLAVEWSQLGGVDLGLDWLLRYFSCIDIKCLQLWAADTCV